MAPMSESLPHLPGTRYQVIKLLGAGGMARVYEAADKKLDRRVAVKVPNERVLRDPVAQERFRREARSVAKLSHDNVVRIYDFVDDEKLPYLVMELVEGRDLERYLEENPSLPLEEAIRITGSILDAVGHAHEQGLIHRDLSPHNILIEDSTGAVKVSDFGIVRALGEKTLTEEGAMVGSVKTMAPEQARGEQVDPSSDLYSVGCLLFYMTTGRLPFPGDNPVQVALKHVNELPVSPAKLNPDLPEQVVDTILTALKKDPAQRFTDAAEMKASLTGKPARKVAAPSAPAPKKGFPWVSVLLVLVICGGMVVAVKRWMGTKVEVPALSGMTVEEGRQSLESLGLELTVSERVASNEYPAEAIIGQSPPAGLAVRPGTVIRVTVSRGPKAILMPDLMGLTEPQAKDKLRDARLRANFKEESDPKIPPGQVKSQNPKAGAEVAPDTVVEVVISSGEAGLEVPNLLGLTEEEAQRALSRLGLEMVVEAYRRQANTPEGQVISQNPSAGARAEKGRRIFLVLSRGSADLNAPDLEGKTVAEARQIVADLGGRLVVDGQARDEDVVVIQDPPAGDYLENPVITVRTGPTTVVPNVMGMDEADARRKLERAGLVVGDVRRYYGEHPGEVMAQHPYPGIECRPGMPVDLEVADPSASRPEPEPLVPEPTPAVSPPAWVED